MKLSELFEKLEKSSEFKKFKKQNKNAYFCAAFFVFDYDSGEEKKQLDYYISEEEGIMTFMLAEKIIAKKAEMAQNEKLPEIKKPEIKIDLPEVLDTVKKEAEKQNFKPAKIIAVLQRLKANEQLIWNITAFSGFTILRMHIAMDKKILMNEKKSMMDLMQIEKGSGSACSGSKLTGKHQSTGSANKDNKGNVETTVGSSADYVG